MAQNDDALAATALALNEDAKASRRRKPKAETPAPPPVDDGRREFELTEADSDELRLIMDDLDAVAAFWKETANESGFDAATLSLIDLTDEGPVRFSAVAFDPQPTEAADETFGEDDRPDAEAATNRGLQLMEQAVEEMSLESPTLVNDLTVGLLEVVKNVQKPWSAHSQHEKRDLVAKIQHIATIVARQAVDVVAADDRVTVKAMLDKITIGDKVTINLTLGAMSDDAKANAVSQLFHAQKKSVLIVTADADRHMSKRREIMEPDEEELPFDAGSDARRAAPDHPEDDSDLADFGEADDE